MPRDVMYLFVYAHTRNNATQLRHMSMWTRPRDVRNKERSLEVANFLKGRHHQYIWTASTCQSSRVSGSRDLATGSDG